MTFGSHATPATVAIVAGLSIALALQARAGGDKVAFPQAYEKGVLYGTVDRPDLKQYRELYVSPPSAVDAARKGEALPSGTVLTMVQYAAKLGAAGNPEKDANGRFIKTPKVVGYTVMEKRTGWGAEYPDSVRNGEWEYQAFLPDRTPNPKANLTNCFTCHKPLGEKVDYVFSYDRLKAAAK